MNPGSFMDFGIPLDQIVLGAVIGVVFLAIYEIAVLIAALIATRSPGPSSRTAADPRRAGPANH